MKVGIKTYLMAPLSPLNPPIYFYVFTSIVCTCYAPVSLVTLKSHFNSIISTESVILQHTLLGECCYISSYVAIAGSQDDSVYTLACLSLGSYKGRFPPSSLQGQQHVYSLILSSATLTYLTRAAQEVSRPRLLAPHEQDVHPSKFQLKITKAPFFRLFVPPVLLFYIQIRLKRRGSPISKHMSATRSNIELPCNAA